MTNAIDSILPNFTLFILVLAPIMIIAFYLMALAVTYFKLKFPPVSARREKIAKSLNFAIPLYMIFPVYDIVAYLTGNLDTIFDELFSKHVPRLTMLILFVGVLQVYCYASSGRHAKEVKTRE